MTSKVTNYIGSSLSNTSLPDISEQCVVMIKPGFTKLLDIEAKITNKILSLGNIKLIFKITGKMSDLQAKEFYIDKKEKKFYDELTTYMSSDNIVAFIFESKDAIKRIRPVVEELRTELKEFYNIPDDVMKNILHATNVKIVNGFESKEDALREIKILYEIKESFKTC